MEWINREHDGGRRATESATGERGNTEIIERDTGGIRKSFRFAYLFRLDLSIATKVLVFIFDLSGSRNFQKRDFSQESRSITALGSFTVLVTDCGSRDLGVFGITDLFPLAGENPDRGGNGGGALGDGSFSGFGATGRRAAIARAPGSIGVATGGGFFREQTGFSIETESDAGPLCHSLDIGFSGADQGIGC
jgi:hypothetical protein